MNNLKSCPFCGVAGADGWAVTHKPDCFIRLLFNKIKNTRKISDAELTEAWNTRIGEDTAVAAEREWIIQYIITHQQKCYVAHGRTMTGVHVLPLIDAIRARGGE